MIPLSACFTLSSLPPPLSHTQNLDNNYGCYDSKSLISMFRCLLRRVGSQQQLRYTVRHLFTIEYQVQASLLTLCRAVMGTSALQYVHSHYMKLETPVCKQSSNNWIASRVFSNQHSSSPVPASLLFAGTYNNLCT